MELTLAVVSPPSLDCSTAPQFAN
uniref:Uncharacterized protein n=1 Tax=Anguilla anguilla TaxID=7936 RepID=A0A0E9RET0_ANGAN